MAAAATTRSSIDAPNPNSKMTSPKDSKARLTAVKSEDTTQDKTGDDVKPVGANTEPLAPPPKPSQNNANTPDYFNSNHGTNHFSSEPNPFEQSFGNPSSETPGRSLLPPIANITSPSPLQGITPGWSSLRSGPLSPAMLAGPTNSNTDYFSDTFNRGFPTPNESSLRTGLTPGGGGSMFPAPSPNSQALFNLQSGGATPNTLDFHRTALSAAAASNGKTFNLNGAQAATSQPLEQGNQSSMNNNFQNGQQAQSQRSQEPYQQDLTGAANDLLQFASQANTNGARNGHFAVPNQPNHLQNQGQQGADASQTHRRNTKGSIGTSISGVSGATDEGSESGQSEQAKPSTRSRKSTGKKGGNKQPANDTPTKGPAAKKRKMSNNMPKEEEPESDEEMHDEDGDQLNENGKKMTDEEKRKNFLERNRVAALKCRQRKKQWLQNLQQKVEVFSTENDALSAQVTALREEVVNLKTLLLAHKDCPVSQAQGLGGGAMSSFIGDVHQHANPYGMGMPPNGMMMGGHGQMQRT